MLEVHCKKCGCYENDACYGDETGPCWWVEKDLCSACAGHQPDAKREVEFLVFDPDDLLPSSVPVCRYDVLDEAIEHAANRKGYVALEEDCGFQSVAWVSPKFDTHLLMVTIINRWNAETSEFLSERREDIMRHVRAHRMSEVA
ncbi:hypothetical protein [Mesorhizobium sp. A556]